MAWAIGVSLAGLWFGLSIIFGHIPGTNSDIGTFRRIAGLAGMAVAAYGPVLAGIGAIAAGLVLGLLCLVSGKGSPDSGLGID
jgi:hypothetical protein